MRIFFLVVLILTAPVIAISGQAEDAAAFIKTSEAASLQAEPRSGSFYSSL